jgi:5-formyltetrahydrofolate cyclo-ligase
MNKQEARKLYKTKRMQLTKTEQNRFDDLILVNFQSLPLPHLQYVHTYLAIKENNEIETDHLLHYLEFRNPGMKIALPRVNEETQSLEHIEYDEDLVIQLSKWKIPEPVNGKMIAEKEIDLIFVPLLAFDTKGHRVGYGKGYYDQFLSQCRPGALKIGLSYFEPLSRISDTEQFDIPLDYCITPQRVYEFG